MLLVGVKPAWKLAIAHSVAPITASFQTTLKYTRFHVRTDNRADASYTLHRMYAFSCRCSVQQLLINHSSTTVNTCTYTTTKPEGVFGRIQYNFTLYQNSAVTWRQAFTMFSFTPIIRAPLTNQLTSCSSPYWMLLIWAQHVKKFFAFMNHKCLLPCSDEPATGPTPQPG